MKYKQLLGSLVFVFSLIMGGCNEWTDHYVGSEAETQDLFERLKQLESADELVDVIEQTGLDKVLAGSDVYTVFIPPRGSFADVDDADLKALVSNHIIFGRNYIESLDDSLKVRSVSGKFFSINNKDGIPKLNNRISLFSIGKEVKDIEARNGVIHSVGNKIDFVSNLEEQFELLDPEKYSLFLEYYNKFDSINPTRDMYTLEFNEHGKVVLTQEPYKEYVCFNASDEKNEYTLMAPSDEAINKQVEELLSLNGGDPSKISPLYYARLIRNQMLRGAYDSDQLFVEDTIITEGESWVVGRKLEQGYYSNPIVASNGYMFEADDVTYEPIAADFIDSIVYEAEWAVGFEGQEKTLVYQTDLEPAVSGDGVNVNHHLFASGLNAGDRLDFFIPNTFKGLYELKMMYKWTNLEVSIGSEKIPVSDGRINLETHVPKDISNEDPNYWAYGKMGYVYLPEDGNMNIKIRISKGMFEALMIDKIVLIPLEY